MAEWSEAGSSRVTVYLPGALETQMDLQRLRGKYLAIGRERNLAPHHESRENQREGCKQNQANTNDQRGRVHETLRFVSPE